MRTLIRTGIKANPNVLLRLGLAEEIDEVVLPDGGLGVGAVAAGGIGDGNEDELCVAAGLCFGPHCRADR